MDALGFKDIWRNHDVDAVSAALSTVRATVDNISSWYRTTGNNYHPLGTLPILTCGWFSDTMFIIAQPGPGVDSVHSDTTRAFLLFVVAMSLGAGIQTAAQGTPPLTFRGAITVGDAFARSDNILLGPAVNEAVALYEQALGAFVWLSPSANSVHAPQDQLSRVLVRYRVPLKTGILDTRAINPFVDTSARSGPQNPIRQGMERAMKDSRLDVAIKCQNTMDFLDSCARAPVV
jgi:hypothetical protein